ncbi:MAG: ATP-binding protein, partial [Verrucomicrobia bacterium]|nr:ATP-binding protein [Verrucomicrobiota bacterium]
MNPEPENLSELRARLAEAEETLRAIRTGEADAVVITAKRGPQVFTLEGAGHAYRVLIESMNEGALTLTPDKMILYANQCFARMVKCPLAKDGLNQAAVSMVVTDMTEARRTVELLRALSQRLLQAQEDERGRVALELHDHITQLLCALVFRSQALAENLPARIGPLKREAMKLRDLLGEAVEEVERISRNLRPSVLDQLGLVAVLRDTCTEFADRTGVPVKVAAAELSERPPADIELTLYRILQEALRNVEKHARARHVSVRLGQEGAFVQLAIHDDGIGFDPKRLTARRKGEGGLGLLSMRERATYVGGSFKVESVPRSGTEIAVRIPLPASARWPANPHFSHSGWFSRLADDGRGGVSAFSASTCGLKAKPPRFTRLRRRQR